MIDKTDICTSFGRTLREARLKSGLSQEKLALQAGLDRTFISLLERGLRQPTLTSLFALSEQLDSSPSKLLVAVENLLNLR